MDEISGIPSVDRPSLETWVDRLSSEFYQNIEDMGGRTLDIMIVDENRNSCDLLILESIWKPLSGALQGLYRGFDPCVTAAVAQLVCETCHDHEKVLKPTKVKLCRKVPTRQPNQGDASQWDCSPIDLQGDAFEGSMQPCQATKIPALPALPS
jgi:hypothetical protein